MSRLKLKTVGLGMIGSMIVTVTVAMTVSAVSIQAHAASTLTCQPAIPGGSPVILGLSDTEMIENATMDGEVIFKSDIATDVVAAYLNVRSDLAKSQVAIHLTKIAVGKLNRKIKTVQATVVVPAEGLDPIERLTLGFPGAMKKIGEDGAGVVLLQFKDKDGAIIGSSLFLGWAGEFKDCR